MQQTWMPDVLPQAATTIAIANEIVFAAEVEEWLSIRAHVPVTWSPRGNGLLAVHDVAEAAARIGELGDEGSWGVLRRTHAAKWAQCMRVDGGWIVEVNGVPGPDCFARRVQRLEKRRRLRRGSKRVRDHGRLMAVYRPEDVTHTALGAAEIMWSWLRGSLPEGYVLYEL